MPFFDEVASNAWAPSQNEVAQRWQKKVAEFDGYIFVTAEYNRGMSGGPEERAGLRLSGMEQEAGGVCRLRRASARARAIEQLRLDRDRAADGADPNGVHIQGADFMAAWKEGKNLKELPHLQQNATDMLDQLVWWTRALQDRARADQSQAAAA